jgi:hypothetical protein
MRKTVSILPLILVVGLSWMSVQDSAKAPRDLVIEVHVLDAVRNPLPFVGQLTVHHPGEVQGDIQLNGVEVQSNGSVLWSQDLDISLRGDSEYGDLQGLIERLPEGVVHRHGEAPERVYSDPSDAEFTLLQGLEVRDDLVRRVQALSNRLAAGERPSFAQPRLIVPVDQLMFPDAPTGSEVSVDLVLHYTLASGVQRTRSLPHLIYKMPSLPGALGNLESGAGYTIHAGDLHVHSCHGEALGACSPSDNCIAESFQLSGSFSLAELKTQFQALGVDWFTSTDHSYCVDTDTEYAAVVSECAALVDANFIAIPDLELSSEEQGPQTGSDLFDLLCLLGPSANHMGAHGISTRLDGGDSGLLGFCNGLFSTALNGFISNISDVNAQGGWTIANHPAAGELGWNSLEATQGQEAGGLHGVEVWNGTSMSGQGGGVGAWVDWLLAGRRLYAYSGSDTHDEAHGFGANCALVDGAFTQANLEDALRAGRSFISNGPSLVIEVGYGSVDLEMGAVQSIPYPVPSAPVDVRAYFDTVGASGTVTLFSGQVGAGGEVVLGTAPGQTGVGTFSMSMNLVASSRSWVRAYFESDDGSLVAYSNPIFFESPDPGCNIDGFSPNHSCAAAAPLVDGSYDLEVCKFEPDFLSFTIAAGDTFDAGLTFSTGVADVDAMLYNAGACSDDQNSGCAFVLACGYSGSDNEDLSWTNVSSVDVDCVLRIHVWPGSPGVANYYSLDVTGITPGGPPINSFCDPANANSSGGPVTLAGSSSGGVLHLEATGGPAGQFGFMLVSGVSVGGIPVSAGVLCLGAPIGRYNVAAGGALNSLGQFSSAGVLVNLAGTSTTGTGFDVPTSLPNPPGGVIIPGATWNFQLWYRDGANSNFSSGIEAGF